MKQRLMHAALAFVASGFMTIATADADQTKAAYYAAGDKAAADYMNAHALCETLDADTQPVCIEEAKLVQTRAKGMAELQYRNDARTRQKVNINIANAEYRVAEARCQSRPANEKEVCIRQANALRSVAVANAKSGSK
jgi:hyperosmotically inducible protein